jgi:hypothetical protein
MKADPEIATAYLEWHTLAMVSGGSGHGLRYLVPIGHSLLFGRFSYGVRNMSYKVEGARSSCGRCGFIRGFAH